MNASWIFEEVRQAKRDFGTKCPKKFVGALTVEVIRRQLQREGIPVSHRDVFIRGVSIEVDLLIPKPEASPKYGLLYEPEDVLVVLEIKSTGSFGEPTIRNIRANFQQVSKSNKAVLCAYVTFTERKGYKWAVTEQALGFRVYTLSWHYGSGANYTTQLTEDWERLLNDIVQVIPDKRR